MRGSRTFEIRVPRMVGAFAATTDIAEYLIPVNADVRTVEAILVAEADNAANPLGVKGVGEVGIVGMNAAVANAVRRATGRRIRTLPIRLDDLL